MKKFFLFLLIAFSFSANAQTIQSVTPTDGTTVSTTLIAHVRLDEPAYAVIISIDAPAKFLKKNKAYAAVMIPNTDDAEKVFDVSGLPADKHILYVDVYSDPRTIVDSRVIIFYK